jgi:hypothetical protein
LATLSTAAVVGAALLGPRTSAATLVEFFRRVDPPGWWTRTARAAGEDPGRSRRLLFRGCAGVLAAAVSVYGLLLGIGTLALRPAAGAAGIALVVGGLVVSPYWIRRL